MTFMAQFYLSVNRLYLLVAFQFGTTDVNPFTQDYRSRTSVPIPLNINSKDDTSFFPIEVS